MIIKVYNDMQWRIGECVSFTIDGVLYWGTVVGIPVESPTNQHEYTLELDKGWE